jgi:hypothetical protein
MRIARARERGLRADSRSHVSTRKRANASRPRDLAIPTGQHALRRSIILQFVKPGELEAVADWQRAR